MNAPAVPSLLVLSALVLTAVVCDLRSRRIPNALVASGIALGLLFSAAAPTGDGLAPGIGGALLGGLAGLALLMPLYVLRVLGAGDVKLLAMVGAWLGAPAVARTALWTLLCGGVLALAWAAATGVLPRVVANLRGAARLGLQGGAAMATTGRLPYALAIASGTAVELWRIARAAS